MKILKCNKCEKNTIVGAADINEISCACGGIRRIESGSIQAIASQAYIILGSLCYYDKQFSKEDHERVLDYFGRIGNGEQCFDEEFLPWPRD